MIKCLIDGFEIGYLESDVKTTLREKKAGARTKDKGFTFDIWHSGMDIDGVMNIAAINIWVGQRPLHSEKLLVMIAISRSRGLSITRVETTPAALQPKPMHMVKACLPCAPVFWKSLSRLNATRGK